MKKNWRIFSHKYKWLLVLISTFFLILAIGGIVFSYAALTAKDQVRNDLQVSVLSGKVTENFVPPTEDNPIGSGDSYKKEVSVKNDANTPFFVRVLVIPEIISSEGIMLESNIGKEIIIDLDGNWLRGEDGFYYYLKKVEPNKSTSNIFTNITLSPSLDSVYADASMTISIKSETIIPSLYCEAWWTGEIPTEGQLKLVNDTLNSIK